MAALDNNFTINGTTYNYLTNHFVQAQHIWIKHPNGEIKPLQPNLKYIINADYRGTEAQTNLVEGQYIKIVPEMLGSERTGNFQVNCEIPGNLLVHCDGETIRQFTTIDPDTNKETFTLQAWNLCSRFEAGEGIKLEVDGNGVTTISCTLVDTDTKFAPDNDLTGYTIVADKLGDPPTTYFRVNNLYSRLKANYGIDITSSFRTEENDPKNADTYIRNIISTDNDPAFEDNLSTLTMTNRYRDNEDTVSGIHFSVYDIYTRLRESSGITIVQGIEDGITTISSNVNFAIMNNLEADPETSGNDFYFEPENGKLHLFNLYNKLSAGEGIVLSSHLDTSSVPHFKTSITAPAAGTGISLKNKTNNNGIITSYSYDLNFQKEDDSGIT